MVDLLLLDTINLRFCTSHHVSFLPLLFIVKASIGVYLRVIHTSASDLLEGILDKACCFLVQSSKINPVGFLTVEFEGQVAFVSIVEIG